jgi:hypothetical protein
MTTVIASTGPSQPEAAWLRLLGAAATVVLATTAYPRGLVRWSRWNRAKSAATRLATGAITGPGRRAGAAVMDDAAAERGAAVDPRGRAYERPRVQALTLDIYVEAQPRDRSIGIVKGYAIAVARREHRRGIETYLLVDDPSKPAAVWVKASEIRLRSAGTRPRAPGHEQ